MSQVTELKGVILDATAEELEELIRILDAWPSFASWLAEWAGGKRRTIADPRDRMRSVPATPGTVIAYFRMMPREK